MNLQNLARCMLILRTPPMVSQEWLNRAFYLLYELGVHELVNVWDIQNEEIRMLPMQWKPFLDLSEVPFFHREHNVRPDEVAFGNPPAC